MVVVVCNDHVFLQCNNLHCVYQGGEPGLFQIQEIALLVGAPRVSGIQRNSFATWSTQRVSDTRNSFATWSTQCVWDTRNSFATWSTESVSDTRNSFACFCTHDHKLSTTK